MQHQHAERVNLFNCTRVYVCYLVLHSTTKGHEIGA